MEAFADWPKYEFQCLIENFVDFFFPPFTLFLKLCNSSFTKVNMILYAN